MTTDDTVTIPRELAERLVSTAHSYDRHELDAILNPPPEFDPGLVEVMAASSWERYGDGRWVDSHHAQPKADWRKNIVSALTAARDAGWEMVETAELEALRELVDVAFNEPDGFNYCRTLAEVHRVTDAQADAIRKAKAAQR